MQVKIRATTPSDYAAVLHLFAEGDAIHAQALPDRFRTAHPTRDASFVDDWIRRPDAELFVAEVDQAIVGVVQFHTVITPELPTAYLRTFIFVDSLVVQSHYRQQGIGRMLMEHVQHWAQAHAITTIELNVFEFNQAAIYLYEQLGYTTLSRRMFWQA